MIVQQFWGKVRGVPVILHAALRLNLWHLGMSPVGSVVQSDVDRHFPDSFFLLMIVRSVKTAFRRLSHSKNIKSMFINIADGFTACFTCSATFNQYFIRVFVATRGKLDLLEGLA